jgi:hypothetical protein
LKPGDVCHKADSQGQKLHLSVSPVLRSSSSKLNYTWTGNIVNNPLLDVVFIKYGDKTAGPFRTVSQFHDYFTLSIGPRRKEPLEGQTPDPYRSMLPDDVPIVFTHGDLHPSNILLSPRDASSGRHIVSIIDWQQSGWYPAYWEYCKARWTAKIGGEWAEKYLPMFVDVWDCFDYWDYFVLARGM